MIDLLLVLILFSGSCVCLDQVSPYGSQKIVDGHDAPIGKFPYQVSMKIGHLENGHFCAGTIINKIWILSAAHCFRSGEENMIQIAAGSNFLNDSRATFFDIVKVVKHKDFNVSFTGNDIAVAKVNVTFDFTNDLIQPVQLGTTYIDSEEHSIAMGWGRNTSEDSINKVTALQYLEMKTLSQKSCLKTLEEIGEVVKESEICAADGKGTGVCYGDSGGALMLEGANIQIGIASWVVGKDYCATGYPDVFTRISSFVGWIYENTDGWEGDYVNQ